MGAGLQVVIGERCCHAVMGIGRCEIRCERGLAGAPFAFITRTDMRCSASALGQDDPLA